MITHLKKSIWLSSIAAVLLLTACGKTETKPAATASAATATAQAATAQPATPTAAAPVTYSAADFKTDGVTLTEGQNFKKVATPQPLQVAGKIEVLEFFWYGCPHCNAIEPMVQAWKKTLGSDVNFIRIPAFWGKPMDEHQKIFYALASLKKNDEMDGKIFHALHEEGLGLAKPELISEFMVKNGIDKTTWDTAYNSFGVNTEATKANSLFKAYGLDGVPSFVVNGKYIAGTAMTGETPATLKVVNKLIEQERGTKK